MTLEAKAVPEPLVLFSQTRSPVDDASTRSVNPSLSRSAAKTESTGPAKNQGHETPHNLSDLGAAGGGRAERTARVGDSADGPAVGLGVGDLVLQIRDRVAGGDDVGLVVAVDVGHEQAPAMDNREVRRRTLCDFVEKEKGLLARG
jgi:hypothetical protein